MPAVAKPPPKAGEKKKRRKKRKRLVMRQLKLKGLWLKTPEDWAYFMEWAKKNAVPKKQPPPEPINRGPKKHLSKLKKRLRTLSQPRIRGTAECVPLPRPIPPTALKAKASKRTKRLARPVLRFEEGCHQWRVTRAALLYEATNTILLLSLPRNRPEPDDCRELGAVSPAAMRRLPTDKDCELAQPKQRPDVECGERDIECVDEQLSPWVDFLAIPNYRVLKEMKDVEMANKYKGRFLAEMKCRNRRAYKEQLRKRKKQKRKKAASQKKKMADEKKKEDSVKSKSKTSLEESRTDVPSDVQASDVDFYDDGISIEEAEPATESVTEPVAEEPEEKTEKEIDDEEECVSDQDEDECMKQRRKEKEAWRYDTSVGCKKLPPEIPKSALNYEASEIIVTLAIPKSYPTDLCKNPYTISEGAKNAVASPRVEELAKPKHQCEPVVRPEPREKDEWGRPIFPPREYGKKLPKVKPYKTRECPEKKQARSAKNSGKSTGKDVKGPGKYTRTDEGIDYEDDFEYYDDDSLSSESQTFPEATETAQEKSEEEPPKKKRKASPRPIDPIACAPSIDPLFDPIGARKQLKERERARKLQEAENEKKEAAEAEERTDSNDAEQT